MLECFSRECFCHLKDEFCNCGYSGFAWKLMTYTFKQLVLFVKLHG